MVPLQKTLEDRLEEAQGHAVQPTSQPQVSFPHG